MIKRRSMNRRPIQESRRFSHKRFLNEDYDLSEEMISALNREMAEAGSIPFDGNSFADSLKVLPSFKSESVSVSKDFWEEVYDYCREQAYENQEWDTEEVWIEESRGRARGKAFRVDHWVGTGVYDSDDMETHVGDYIESSDPATQYIIDCAFLEGFYFELIISGYEEDDGSESDGECCHGEIVFYN